MKKVKHWTANVFHRNYLCHGFTSVQMNSSQSGHLRVHVREDPAILARELQWAALDVMVGKKISNRMRLREGQLRLAGWVKGKRKWIERPQITHTIKHKVQETEDKSKTKPELNYGFTSNQRHDYIVSRDTSFPLGMMFLYIYIYIYCHFLSLLDSKCRH